MSKSDTNPQSNIKVSVDSQAPKELFRHLTPTEQPTSVHEISEALYRPFTENGSSGLKFHISGCTIDPVPLVQLATGEFRLLNGQVVAPEYATSLGLDDLDQLEVPPTVWNSSGRREKFLQLLDGIRCQERLAQAADGRQWIVWCNHFHGTMTVDAETPGEMSSPESSQAESSRIEIPFSLWGSRLVKGLDRIPPMTCPLTGCETYQLAVDDEGVITDASSIVTCPETSRRVVVTRLQKCHSTGHLVDPAVLTVCPVTNHHFLERLKSVCHGCFQTVDPATLVKNICSACRGLQKIRSVDFLTDERLSGLLSQQPWLKECRKIKLSRQPEFWLLELQYLPHGKSIWRMLFDRQTGRVCQVSRSQGWLRSWENVPKTNWPEFIVNI